MKVTKNPVVICAAIAAKIALHLSCIAQYGYFRDELYYIASTSHLSFGYVDHPPLSIVLLYLHTAIFGDSLISIRALSVLAGSLVIPLTALIARELGGDTYAQCLAAFSVVVPPSYLGTHHIYSMNAWDHLFWTAAILLLIRILNRRQDRLWPALGVALGAGLLNKISVLWLGCGIAVGLLLTPHRKRLFSPGPWIALGLALILFSPYAIWNWIHGMPTVEFIRNASAMKMVPTEPLQFIKNQIIEMSPALFPLWFAGLAFLLRSKEWRVLAFIYLTVFFILVLSPTSKSSYLVAAYPMLFAAGAVFFERLFSRRWGVYWKACMPVVMILLSVPLIPFAIPILPVQTFLRYASWVGLQPPANERNQLGELPQHFADMFGWEEMAQKTAQVYESLSPLEKKHCIIFGQNYGEAGAIDVLGRKFGLPRATSGHNSYWLWGPSDPHPVAVIILNGNVQDDSEFFESVTAANTVQCKLCMPYERDAVITVGRHPKASFLEIWPRLKRFI